MRISFFIWNAGKLSLCETSSETVKQANRSNVFKRLFRGDCVLPDFITTLENMLVTGRVDLAVFLTIDIGKESRFHSNLLPDYLEKIGYHQILRMKDNQVSGDADLRISVYANESYYSRVQVTNDGTESCTAKAGIIDRVGGVIGFRLMVPGVGRLGFIGAYLPESEKSLLNVERGDLDVHTYRRNVVAVNNICLQAAKTRLWGNIQKEKFPNFIFVFGDLNYQVNIPDEVPNPYIKKNKIYSYATLKQYDELNEEITRGIFKGYQEGVGGAGPKHNPDYPLVVDRDRPCQTSKDCYELVGLFPSWTQRIIYKDMGTSRNKLTCLGYDTIDVGNISKSDHTALTGLFEIGNIEGAEVRESRVRVPGK